MTPTLWGRWQTRSFVLATVGGLVTFGFGLLYNNLQAVFGFLAYITIFGLLWDVLYTWIQSWRWDHDWPAVFQFGAAVVEAVLVWAIYRTLGLPGLDAGVSGAQFVAHYATVWLATFLWIQGPMRILFPRWRFRGGQWL